MLRLLDRLGIAGQIVGRIEPGDLLGDVDVRICRQAIRLVESADRKVELAVVVVCLIGQRRAATAAKAPLHGGGRSIDRGFPFAPAEAVTDAETREGGDGRARLSSAGETMAMADPDGRP